ncbi:hypothetical protein SCARR_00224 [Pontiella sulfatireligans]|uniref:Uncharacterized protein n=1 Tax=Pontiella sulfatireligans TaxID=2750658 RepID=A0A6C2UE83_9BACT|nr:hypothetical protein SCARR_00224 [Pontiella sulfatireligans]
MPDEEAQISKVRNLYGRHGLIGGEYKCDVRMYGSKGIKSAGNG